MAWMLIEPALPWPEGCSRKLGTLRASSNALFPVLEALYPAGGTHRTSSSSSLKTSSPHDITIPTLAFVVLFGKVSANAMLLLLLCKDHSPSPRHRLLSNHHQLVERSLTPLGRWGNSGLLQAHYSSGSAAVPCMPATLLCTAFSGHSVGAWDAAFPEIAAYALSP
jgi:hypothetical protein